MALPGLRGGRGRGRRRPSSRPLPSAGPPPPRRTPWPSIALPSECRPQPSAPNLDSVAPAPAPAAAADVAPSVLSQLPAAEPMAPPRRGIRWRERRGRDRRGWRRPRSRRTRKPGVNFESLKLKSDGRGRAERRGPGLRKERWLSPRVRAWSGAPGWTGGLGRMH